MGAKGESIMVNYEALSGGFDYVQDESTAPPTDDAAVWAKINLGMNKTNADGGSEIWSHSLHSGNVRSVFERDGVVYSGSTDTTVKAADATDGSEIWSHSLHSSNLWSVFDEMALCTAGRRYT